MVDEYFLQYDKMQTPPRRIKLEKINISYSICELKS